MKYFSIVSMGVLIIFKGSMNLVFKVFFALLTSYFLRKSVYSKIIFFICTKISIYIPIDEAHPQNKTNEYCIRTKQYFFLTKMYSKCSHPMQHKLKISKINIVL